MKTTGACAAVLSTLSFFAITGAAITLSGCVEGPNEAVQEVTIEPGTQDSTGIQTAIDTLPTEGGIVLLKAGLWNMDPDAIPTPPPPADDIAGHVLLRDNITIQCERGAELRWSGASWGLIFQGAGVDNVTIDGCDFTIDVDCSSMPTPGCEDPRAWTPDTTYSAVGMKVKNGANVYELASIGTSAASGGPTGTGSGIVDNLATWDYVGTGVGVPTNYHTSISMRPASNIRIANNSFRYVGDTPSPTDTMHAVLGSFDNALISDNVVTHMQIKAGVGSDSGAVRRNLSIVNNQFLEPFNYAVSVVSQIADEGWDGLDISHNLILDPGSNGTIYVGPDGEPKDCARLTGLNISNNVMRGAWGTNTKGILVRSCEVSSGWTISDNVMLNDGSLLAIYGMRLSDNQGHPAHRVTVSGNIVGGEGAGFDQYGISVSTKGDTWVVDGNAIDGARGMSVTLGGDGYVVSDNIIKSQSHGLTVTAQGSGFTNLIVSGNVIKADTAWKDVVHRDDGASLTFDAFFNGNKLDAGTNVTLWGGDAVGFCSNNRPSDC